jgi:hypothetical protein
VSLLLATLDGSVTGVVAQTLANATSAASGAVQVTGTTAVTLGSATSAAAGQHEASVRINADADAPFRTTNLPASNNITFFCFVKLNSSASQFNAIFFLDNASDYQGIETNNDASHTLLGADGGAGDVLGGAMTVGDWYAVGYSSNGTTFRLWQKNLTTGGATAQYTMVARATNPVGAGWTFWLGGNGFGETGDVSMRSPQVYRTAWTQTEFDAQVASLTPVSTTNIDSWFTFRDENATALTDDQSANGRDLSLNGGGTWTADDLPPLGSGVTGTIAVTLANATSAASGSTVAGTIAQTLGSATSAAAGARGAAGTTAVTLAGSTLAASGSSVVGSVGLALGNATSVASGARGAAGTSAVTLGSATSSAAGQHAIGGSVAVALGNATSSAAGGVGASGIVAVTLGSATCIAAGSYGNDVTGTITRTLDSATSAAAGLVRVEGTVATTLGNATSSAAGARGAAGTVAVTLGATTSTAAGAVGAAGSVGVTLAGVTSTASGARGATGTASATLAGVTSAAAGWIRVTGTASASLASSTLAAAGGHGVSGATAVTLASAACSASGDVLGAITGAGSATLADVTAAALGLTGRELPYSYGSGSSRATTSRGASGVALEADTSSQVTCTTATGAEQVQVEQAGPTRVVLG